METQMIKIKDIKPNPNNPRSIKKEQLEKLKKSIIAFPQMLNIRPIVINEDNIVLGGNMRLRALQDLGYDEVPYVRVQDLTPEQQEQFIIKDNVNYGDWNWELINIDWNLNNLTEWGLDIPAWLNDNEVEPEFDEDIRHKYLDTYINAKVKQIVLFLSAEQFEKAITDLEQIMDANNLESNTDAILFLIERYYEDIKLKQETD